MTRTSSKVVVVGTGYVGLTTGACLAHLGHSVVCVDNDEAKLAAIGSGVMPIHEPGLDEMVAEHLANGRLALSSNLAAAVATVEFIFMCLPTPPSDDGSADVSVLRSVATSLAGVLPAGVVVINKSTVPVTSSRQIEALLGGGHPVVSNPEFLREGSAIADFLGPDRIVIGTDNLEAGQRVAALYAGLDAPVVMTDPESAETIKYMANSFLAAKVSFVNEVARFCDKVGADVGEVLRGIAFDPRIGASFLSPGPGWGGSCFPKDTRALVANARSLGVRMSLVETAIASNEEQMRYIVNTVRSEAARYESPRIATLGLSFKAMTDDVRESPAVRIAEDLQREGFDIVVYDPVARGPSAFDDIRCGDLHSTIVGAHIVLILTEWPEFASMDPRTVADLMAGRSIVDSRYLLDKDKFEAAGFRVITVG